MRVILLLTAYIIFHVSNIKAHASNTYLCFLTHSKSIDDEFYEEKNSAFIAILYNNKFVDAENECSFELKQHITAVQLDQSWKNGNKNKLSKTIIIDGLNHMFFHGTGISLASEYYAVGQTDLKVIETITMWVNSI
jgi:uncharacterized protein (DUF924 family)